MARRRYHHGNLRSELIKVSRELIVNKGVDGFSLRAAARAAGVDPAACYRHFANRDAVLDAVAREGFARMAEMMERAVARASSPRDAVRALGRAYIRFAETHAAEFRTMFGRTGTSAREPRLRGESAHGRSPFEILSAAVQNWQPELDGSQVEAVANVLWAGTHGVAALITTGAWAMSKPRRQAHIDALLDALVTGTSR